MELHEVLAALVGRSVEIFLDNQFLQGNLRSAAQGIVTLDVTNPSYTTPAATTSVLVQNIEFIRVLAA